MTVLRTCLKVPAVSEARATDLLMCGGCGMPALREQTWIGFDGFRDGWFPFCITCDPARHTVYPDDPATIRRNGEPLEIVE
jgi:hypothetical protein